MPDGPGNPSHITICHSTITGLNFRGDVLEAMRCSKAISPVSKHGTILYVKITDGELSLKETKKDIEIIFNNGQTVKDFIASVQINQRPITQAVPSQIVGIRLKNTSLKEIRNLIAPD